MDSLLGWLSQYGYAGLFALLVLGGWIARAEQDLSAAEAMRQILLKDPPPWRKAIVG